MQSYQLYLTHPLLNLFFKTACNGEIATSLLNNSRVLTTVSKLKSQQG